MKADILVKDVNESSCIITIYYSRTYFDAWFSGSKPFGPSTSGDCSAFGVTAAHLKDGINILNLDFGPLFVPGLMIEAGKSGKGWVHSNGFLKTGDITWQIWNTCRTGDWGDDWMKEKSIN
ncbi:MAG TPA: hypothetical protein PKE69_03110 [Pyrinomonadaceae bacterium]|nr:hypothetical protein [Pyrinomonadaceae bacterium]